MQAPASRRAGVTFLSSLPFLVFLISASFYWQGLGVIGDAEKYVAAAMRWVIEGPNLGENHWALRHLFVLPMAASFQLIGPNELAATMPNILYAGGLVFITYYFGRRYFGETDAIVAAALAATSAYFVSRPMEISIYGPEAFFVALACWLFIGADIERRRIRHFFFAGAATGLAWTIREQTVALLAAFAVVSLVFRRQTLLSWTALGLGFGSILLVEWAVYLAAAGDPFYRYKIDLLHRVRGGAAIALNYDSPWSKLMLPFKDNLSDPLTTPVLMIACALAIAARKTDLYASGEKVRALTAFAIISTVSVFSAAYAFNLSLPRYYPAFPYFVLVFCGLSVASLARAHKFRVAVGAFLAILVTNVFVEEFGSYKEYAEARIMVDLIEEADAPIFSDPLTSSRARHLLLLKRAPHSEISRLVPSEKAIPSGSLFFKAAPTERIDKNWCVLSKQDPPRKNWAHALIRMSGLSELVGGKLRKIVRKPAPVMLVRTLPDAAEFDPYSLHACIR